jgi:hypothetical protein
VVVEAENASDLPGAVVVVPEVDETPSAVRNRGFGVGMGKTVNSDFKGAVVMDAEHFEGPGC